MTFPRLLTCGDFSAHATPPSSQSAAELESSREALRFSQMVSDLTHQAGHTLGFVFRMGKLKNLTANFGVPRPDYYTLQICPHLGDRWLYPYLWSRILMDPSGSRNVLQDLMPPSSFLGALIEDWKTCISEPIVEIAFQCPLQP